MFFNKFRRTVCKLLIGCISVYISIFIAMLSITIASNEPEDSNSEIATSINTTSITTINSTTVATTVVSTSTSVSTTEATTETEVIKNEIVDEEIYETEVTEVIEDYSEESIENNSYISESNIEGEGSYIGCFTAKWYDNIGLGYTDGTTAYGYSGRDLISGYSVASNYFAQGTLLYIKGGSHDGYYRVDDSGYMSSDTIDFYYSSRSDIPDQFCYEGVQYVEVWVVE